MPCDSIITQSVSLDKVTSPELLKTALESIGAQYICRSDAVVAFRLSGIWYQISKGKLKGSGYSADADTVGRTADLIKQGYSRAAVYAAAKRNRWDVVETAKNQFTVKRRF